MRRSIASLRLCIVVAAILTAVTRAANSCFNTDPPYTVVRGQPFILTWQLQGSEYDLFLATAEGETLGYISRNITESSLSWTPPLNISNGPFSFGLFMLNRQSTCFSDNFTITGSQNAEFVQPSAPLTTTVVTINSLPTTVTATVASWTPNARATETPTPTLTEVPTNFPLTESSSSGLSEAAKIGIGVAIGALVLIVLVLGVLLYRTRRKRANTPPAPPSPLDPPDTKRKLVDESNRSSAYTELDGAQRSELAARERVQLEGRGKPEGWRPGTEYSEMSTGATEGRWELDAGRDGVAELPGDEPREKKG